MNIKEFNEFKEKLIEIAKIKGVSSWEDFFVIDLEHTDTESIRIMSLENQYDNYSPNIMDCYITQEDLELDTKQLLLDIRLKEEESKRKADVLAQEQRNKWLRQQEESEKLEYKRLQLKYGK